VSEHLSVCDIRTVMENNERNWNFGDGFGRDMTSAVPSIIEIGVNIFRPLVYRRTLSIATSNPFFF